MLRRFALVPLLLVGLVRVARADDHGAVVVAETDASAPAAKALARELYKDDALRPSIDEPTARVLSGEAPAAGATDALKELADLRATLVGAANAAAKKQLLASIGARSHATLVVDVVIGADRPIARVLRTSSASFEGADLAGALTTSEGGDARATWAGASTSIRALLGPAAIAPVAPPPATTSAPKSTPPPLKPEKEAPRAPIDVPTVSTSMLKSPWFWGAVGVVLTAGVTVFVLSKTNGDATGNFHVTGMVPR